MISTIDDARRAFHEGRLDEALRHCAALIEANADVGEAHHLRAAVALKQGLVDEALRRLELGLAHQPSGTMYNTLATIHLQRGDGTAARQALEQARECKQFDDPRLWPNVGRALLLEGKPDEAAQWLDRAVEAKPDWPAAWFVKGLVEDARGRHSAAARAYERAADLQSGWPDALLQAAASWRAGGAPAAARARVLRVLEGHPSHPAAREALLDLLPLPLEPAETELVRWVERIVVEGADGLQRVANALPACLRAHAGWVRLLGRFAADPGETLDDGEASLVVQTPLLAPVLQAALVTDLDLEAVLTAWRRNALTIVGTGGDLDDPEGALATAVACHGWRSGYAWRESSDESAALVALGARPVERLLHACYRRPDERAGLPPAVSALVARASALRRRARGLTVARAPQGETSRTVAAQYEEHPYPLWDSLPAAGAATTPWQAATRIAGAQMRIEAPRFDGSPHILVAGCGTGRHAIDVARRYRPASVTAVDISRASLAYAEWRAAKMGVDVGFFVADIAGLKPEDFAHRFHHVESVGVLHHLADPLEGWRRLRALLAPAATMKIGLYSRTFRSLLEPARSHAGVVDAHTDNGLRAARTRLLTTCPPPDLAPLLAFSDLYSTAGLRDLLFHPCEHSYDLDEVAAMLDALGLRFLGFDDLPPATMGAFTARHGAGARASLKSWSVFEQANRQAFRCMYVFWCQAEG